MGRRLLTRRDREEIKRVGRHVQSAANSRALDPVSPICPDGWFSVSFGKVGRMEGVSQIGPGFVAHSPVGVTEFIACKQGDTPAMNATNLQRIGHLSPNDSGCASYAQPPMPYEHRFDQGVFVF